MLRRPAALLLNAFFLASTGCGSDGGGGGNPITLTVAKTPTNSGDGQTGAAGTALPSPLRVVVTDGGVAQAGTEVTWSTTNGGSLAPASGSTDVNGIAASVWTLGPGGGAQTARATVSGAINSPITFPATATTGPVIVLAKAGGDGQYQTVDQVLPQMLRVRATSDGAPLTTAQVAWTGPGSFNPATSAADASGFLTTTWTLGPGIGPQSATATLVGAAVAPVVFDATGLAPNVVAVVNNSFHPASMTLHGGGETVTWVWQTGATGHNSKPSPTNAAAIPNSGGAIDEVHTAPFQFSAAFTTSGTYRFYCTVHGFLDPGGTVSGMSGQIVVP